MRPVIELCVEGVDGAVAAQQGGADRIELCASLMEGGITPSLGTLRATLAAVSLPLFVMVRPRGGDFLYSEREFASMLDDVALFRDAGAAGVVFGCLTADGRVDEARTAALVTQARPVKATFHRAFDMAADPFEALEALIRCGIDRVLTSGQAPDGVAGMEMMGRLVAQARGRIVVLGCGGLRPETVGLVRRTAGLSELHFSAPAAVASGMRYRKDNLAMGSAPLEREFTHVGTDPSLVQAIIAAAQV
jgi:copper homeostasis protein